jgi:hypothetical protein
MPTDYVLFIHGVNTRETASDPTYADQLFDLMQKQDIIIAPVGLIDRAAGLDRQATVALIDFRTAHLSYFQSQQVTEVFTQAIVESSRVAYST